MSLNRFSPIFLFVVLSFCAPTILTGETVIEFKSDMTPGPIKELILNENPSKELLDKLASYSADELISGIMDFSELPLPTVMGCLVKNTHKINDSLEAPYYVYCPKTYSPANPTPVVIWLHGGVSRKEFIEDAN